MKGIVVVFSILLFANSVCMGQKKNQQVEEQFAQTTITEDIKPKIMVIPYSSEGEDLRALIENDVNKRIVLNKIRESFDNLGYTTIDVIPKLKAISNNSAFMDGTKQDIKNMLIENSGADIYVEAEIVVSNSGAGTGVKIVLTGYDASTGASLSNAVGESGSFPGLNDIAKLGQTAVENCRDQFLAILQAKFADMLQNGRSIMINIGFDEGSPYTMESEVGNQNLQLSDEIELWIDEHAYNNIYHIQGTTTTMMILDDVRIPIIDPQTGRNFNVNRFGMEVMKFMRSLGLTIQRDIKGNTLYIKIK